MRIEARQIVFHDSRCIAFRIDSDEQSTGAISILAERMHDFGHLEQRRRAHVRAVCIAKEHQEWPTLYIRIADGFAILVDQLERTTDRRCTQSGTAEVPGGVNKYAREN